MSRARGGDAEAYAVLLRRHRERLDRVCERVVGDRALGADVAQEAALVAWLQLGRLREPECFGAWLAGIGRMLALRERRRLAAAERLTSHGSLIARYADAGDEPAERLLARERAVELASAIAALPAGQRDAVALFHLADLSQESVARRLGTSPGAVRTRLHKARAALRVRLTDHDEGAPQMPDELIAQVLDVRRTPAGRHVVVLSAGDHEIPIWIGASEAEELAVVLEDVERPRPSTHALALSLLRASGREATSVRITRLDESIFYAEVVLDSEVRVDARPSDALVLAVAAGLPIEVDPELFEATLHPPREYADDELARLRSNG